MIEADYVTEGHGDRDRFVVQNTRKYADIMHHQCVKFSKKEIKE